MSDIPIGSPPVPPGRHAAPQGWYPDPVDNTRERYWDGWSWSRNTRESAHAGAQLPDPYQQSPFQAPFPPRGGQHSPQHGQRGQHGQHQQQPRHPPYQQPYPQQAGQPQPPALTADGVLIAAWGWRLLAGILDLIIVSIVTDIASIPVLIRALPVLRQYFDSLWAAAQTGAAAPPTLDPTTLLSSNDQILITVISVVVGVLYFGLFWRFKAATPAQLLCGLRIVPTDHGHNTELLPWQSVAVRALAWWVPIAVSSVLLIFTIVNVLFPLGNVKRQAIHDLVARTQVVKIR